MISSQVVFKTRDEKPKILAKVQAPVWVVGNGWQPELLFIELHGEPEPCRRIWAHLVKSRPERSLTITQVTIDDMQLHVMPGQKYFRLQDPPFMLAHIGFHKDRMEYLLGGDEATPPQLFHQALRRITMMPYKLSWLPTIWQEGQESGRFILPMKSQGINAWMLSQSNHWDKLIIELVKKRRVAWQD